jgi:hypothetical protein
MNYYDRKAATILIDISDDTITNAKCPCLSRVNTFPSDINASKIDSTLLDILSVASNSNDVRLNFIFYYQILEYCSYYHLNAEVDNKLKKILKRPDINHNSNDNIKEIIEILK